MKSVHRSSSQTKKPLGSGSPTQRKFGAVWNSQRASRNPAYAPAATTTPSVPHQAHPALSRHMRATVFAVSHPAAARIGMEKRKLNMTWRGWRSVKAVVAVRRRIGRGHSLFALTPAGGRLGALVRSRNNSMASSLPAKAHCFSSENARSGL